MIRCSFLLCVIVATAVGQIPKPRAELARFEPFLGDWRGSGQVFEAFGSPPRTLQAQTSVRRILGGHFVIEDAHVTLEGVPVPLLRRTLYWYDTTAESFMALTVSNMGSTSVGPAVFTEDGALVAPATHQEEGRGLITDRVSHRIADNGVRTFFMHRSQNGAPEFIHVTATYSRDDEAIDVAEASADTALAPMQDAMKLLEGFLGKWTIAGTMHPIPGMPAMPLSATQKVTRAFGGHCNVGVMETTPLPGFGKVTTLTHITYDPSRKTLISLSLDSFGGAILEEVVKNPNGQFVLLGRSMAVPMGTRTLISFGDGGATFRMVVDQLRGGDDALRSLDATFTKTNTGR